MKPEEIRELYEYNAWANRRVLEACSTLTDEQLSRDLGSSFRSVRGTLVHIVSGEWLWLERWRGRSPAMAEVEQFANHLTSLASIRTCWERMERDLLAFVAALSAADLERTVEYRNLGGNRFAYSLRSMLQHLVNHNSYHRGQVTTMLRQLGATPRATDFLRYFDALAGQPEE